MEERRLSAHEIYQSPLFVTLRGHHANIKSLCEEVSDAIEKGNFDNCNKLFPRLRAALNSYMKAEEELVYPDINDYEGYDIEKGVEEHRRATALADELANSKIGDASWRKKFENLKDLINTHFSDEEAMSYTNLKKDLTLDELENVHKKFNKRKAELEEAQRLAG